MGREILYRAGGDFEAEALRGDDFQSLEQVEMAALALERAGLLRRVADEAGGARWLVVRDITPADFAAALAAHHKHEIEQES